MLRIALNSNLQITLGNSIILTILSFPGHEHELSFHLLRLISLSNILQFSVNKSSASLIKFIPKYFIGFDAIAIGIVFFVCGVFHCLHIEIQMFLCFDFISSNFAVLVFGFNRLFVDFLRFGSLKIMSFARRDS